MTDRAEGSMRSTRSRMSGVDGNPSPSDLWRFFRSPRPSWPRHVPVETVKPPAPIPGELVATSIGHASFLLQTPKVALLTDPVFADRAGPFGLLGPRRVRDPGVTFNDLPPIDVVLVSHNHYDHCDARSLRRIARRFDPQFVTLRGNAGLLRRLGARRVTELEWWEQTGPGEVDIVATPARHFSARTPFDRNRALWGGFMFRADGHRVYFAGDTGYGEHFRQIGQRLGPIDLALLPIGAYEPDWFMQPIHMNPEEAVQAHLDLGASKSAAMHHGVFRLTLEPMDEPVQRLGADLVARGLPPEAFVAPVPGDSLTLDRTADPQRSRRERRQPGA